jgi:hypothetical protein
MSFTLCRQRLVIRRSPLGWAAYVQIAFKNRNEIQHVRMFVMIWSDFD